LQEKEKEKNVDDPGGFESRLSANNRMLTGIGLDRIALRWSTGRVLWGWNGEDIWSGYL